MLKGLMGQSIGQNTRQGLEWRGMMIAVLCNWLAEDGVERSRGVGRSMRQGSVAGYDDCSLYVPARKNTTTK